jgi:hypothetical protein
LSTPEYVSDAGYSGKGGAAPQIFFTQSNSHQADQVQTLVLSGFANMDDYFLSNDAFNSAGGLYTGNLATDATNIAATLNAVGAGVTVTPVTRTVVGAAPAIATEVFLVTFTAAGGFDDPAALLTGFGSGSGTVTR